MATTAYGKTGGTLAPSGRQRIAPERDQTFNVSERAVARMARGGRQQNPRIGSNPRLQGVKGSYRP